MEVEHQGRSTIITLEQAELAELNAGGMVASNQGIPGLFTSLRVFGDLYDDYPRASLGDSSSLYISVPRDFTPPWTIPRGAIRAVNGNGRLENKLMQYYGARGEQARKSFYGYGGSIAIKAALDDRKR